MAERNGTGQGMTVDELARHAQLPVRTIREYHTMRLLPPPVRQGRVGIYDPAHVKRLELIARLQRRGYSLAGIRDLLDAWAAGADLTSVLGIEPGQAALDEMPLRLTRAELLDRAPALSGQSLADACEAGLVQPCDDAFLVRSPALLALVADGTAAGMPVGDMLRLAGTLREQLGSLADSIADLITDRMLPEQQVAHDLGDIVPLLRRGRLLLLQAAASMLADRLAAALEQRSSGTHGAALRAALDQIRVGAVTDGSGSVRYPAAR
jgi:DNA-binding transcriptional MerR regulator